MATNTSGTPTPDSDGAATVSFETTAKVMLQTALALHASNSPLVCDEIRSGVAKLCADGKSRGVQAERLIVELKRAWYSVPESAGHEKAEVISRLVTMCVQEYYRGDTAR